ncbi:unnamed protein product [Hyaloperonospora brassicae]|uniref:Protein kinase domain-containing protein n=1 Tax=Hyaloperonospora brassicae TaxID=162125 RepID=A0AAV0UXH7_HYABA|nr:unnamed protein product [Hyaloperonospora brassicae]
MSPFDAAAGIVSDSTDTWTGTTPRAPTSTPAIASPAQNPTHATSGPATTPTPNPRSAALTSRTTPGEAAVASLSSPPSPVIEVVSHTPAPDSGTSSSTAVSVITVPSTSAAGPSSSLGLGGAHEPASAAASANASTTVVITVGSHSSDGDASSGLIVVTSDDSGMDTGSILSVAAGSIAAVLLVIGICWWLCRRRRSKRTARSSSFEIPYTAGPFPIPAADPITLESYTPSSAAGAVQDLDFIDRTVDLDGTANFDSTLRLEHSATSVMTKKSSKSNSSLSEDEVITAARIPLEKLTRKELINEGGHGAVYKGLYRGEDVAIKVLLPEKRKDMRQINLFLAEIKMMATVEHPHIVRFVGVAWDALSDLCAVSEFMPGGDLFALLRRFDRVEHRVRGFDVDKATIALHVAQALTYLHSLDPIVLHRDLKSMNVLLSAKLEAKLTDFGVSRKYTANTMTAGVGTRRWMAPEVMMGKRYNTSADIFSFGVVLSELDSHQPPYASAIATITTESGEKVSETALMEMVVMGRIRVDFSSNAPTALVELGHACVAVDPTARPNAADVHYQLQKLLRKYQKYTL